MIKDYEALVSPEATGSKVIKEPEELSEDALFAVQLELLESSATIRLWAEKYLLCQEKYDRLLERLKRDTEMIVSLKKEYPDIFYELLEKKQGI